MTRKETGWKPQFSKECMMKNSVSILATIALGAVLAAGSATASMARGGGGGGGGHMGDGGGGDHMGGGFGGSHAGATPFIMNHGGGFGGSHSFGSHPYAMSHGGDRGMGMRHGDGGDHGFDGRRRFDRFRDDGDDDFFAFGPFGGPDQYWADNDSGAAYCARLYRSYDPASGTYLGRHGVRYYCP